MVGSILGYGRIPGSIGLSVKTVTPRTKHGFYIPRRKDLVKVFENVALIRSMRKTTIMPRFKECSDDMVLYLKRILGRHSKKVLGNYAHKFVSKLYNTKPLKTDVVYKMNDKIEYDVLKRYYQVKIRGYDVKGDKKGNYYYRNAIRLKPGMLIHETKTVGHAGFEKKHLVMWLGWINSLGGAYYFDSRWPKIHKWDEKKNFVGSKISKYYFWRIVAIYDPWHGRE